MSYATTLRTQRLVLLICGSPRKANEEKSGTIQLVSPPHQNGACGCQIVLFAAGF
jgi:hypothetical protein